MGNNWTLCPECLEQVDDDGNGEPWNHTCRPVQSAESVPLSEKPPNSKVHVPQLVVQMIEYRGTSFWLKWAATMIGMYIANGRDLSELKTLIQQQADRFEKMHDEAAVAFKAECASTITSQPYIGQIMAECDCSNQAECLQANCCIAVRNKV